MTHSPLSSSMPFDENNGGFRMLDYVDRLTPTEKKNKYLCPVCKGNDLSVDPNTSAYTCFSGGCDRALIREAIAPMSAKHEMKIARPNQEKIWTYTDANGQPLIRTRRIDRVDEKRKIWQEYFMDGRWVSGGKAPASLKAEAKANVVLYRWAEIQAAIAKGETIFWVEGEPCADALWKIGLPATTSIGGSSALEQYGDYSSLLKGASLVICPDRDQVGLKYAEGIAAWYPDAKWLYAFSDSPVWSALPKDKGVDVEDWLASGATKDQLIAAIEEQRSLLPPNVIDLQAKRNAKFEPELSLPEVYAEIQKLQTEFMEPSILTARLIELGQKSGLKLADVRLLHSEIVLEFERKERTLKQASEMIAQQASALNAGDYFHELLSNALEATAQAMPTSSSWLITTLLPALGAAIGASSRLVIKASAKYIVSPVVWSMIVSQSGRKKSPAQGQIVDPMKELEIEAWEAHQQNLKAYKKEVAAASKSKDKDTEIPDPPERKRWLSQNSTSEGLTKALQHAPALLVYRDELAGHFRGFNAYKQGKGSDEEFWLEVFNGNAIINDRADFDKSCVVKKTNVGLTGSIQWQVLQSLQSKKGDFGDASGMFARFLICADEAPKSQLSLDDEHDRPSELPELLKFLYEELRRLPERDYLMSPVAKQLFQVFQHRMVELADLEDHPGLALVYPKLETYAARLALILHLTNAAAAGLEPEPVVGGETMQQAIRLTEYYLEQAKLVYATNDPFSRDSVLLLQIINKARLLGGKVSIQKLKQSRDFDKVSAIEIQQLFVRGEAEGFGTIEKESVPGQKDVVFFVVGAALTQLQKQILNAAQRKGTLTAGVARGRVYALRAENYSDERIWAEFAAISEAGFGKVEGDGRQTRLVIAGVTPEADIVDEYVAPDATPFAEAPVIEVEVTGAMPDCNTSQGLSNAPTIPTEPSRIPFTIGDIVYCGNAAFRVADVDKAKKLLKDCNGSAYNVEDCCMAIPAKNVPEQLCVHSRKPGWIGALHETQGVVVDVLWIASPDNAHQNRRNSSYPDRYPVSDVSLFSAESFAVVN